jgi:hypothetical protein
MSYPKTLLTRPIRLSIMIFLFVIFFVASPIIILYTAGYRFDFENKQIKQIGVIGIDVEPRNVAVYLNDIQIDKKPPMRLSNRAPGTYNLKITLPGYHSWEKEITVESKKTTYIRDVTLFKESLPIQIIKDSFESVSFSPDGKYALLISQNELVYETYFLDLYDLQTIPLARIYSAVKPKISWSPFYPAAAIIVNKDGETQIQIVDMLHPENSSMVHKVSRTEADNFQWQPDDSPWLYIKINREIFRLSPTTQKAIFSYEDDNLWYVDKSQNLWKYIPSENVIQLQKNGNETNFMINDEILKLIYIEENKIIYKTNDGTKINYKTSTGERETKMLPTLYNDFNKITNEWLSWSPLELWTIYQNNQINLLYRTSEKIEYILPLDNFGVLLIANKNKIQAFNPGYYMSTELFSEGEIYSLGTDLTNRRILFWGKVGNEKGIFELEY